MNHGSLFSGIGGFDLAAEWMGWTNVFNCEWEEFPRQVLRHHFPKTKQYGDIKDFDATAYAGRIDILTGGFPCQPYSAAGRKLGKDDDRHLWPEMLRVIRECSPRYVVGENVRGLVSWNGGLVFEEVCADLEALGYSVQPCLLGAASVNAPHKRMRVWFIAHAERVRLEHPEERRGMGEVQGQVGRQPTHTSQAVGGPGPIAHTSHQRLQGGKQHGASNQREQQSESLRSIAQRDQIGNWEHFPTQPPVCGGDDGIPRELDSIAFSKWRKESIKGYGNAIVPQVAHQIFKAIEQYERLDR